MSKIFSIKELSYLVTNIANFSKIDMTSNEANTKKKIVEPLLEILGWNLLSNEVRLEYPVRIGSSTIYVDYALMLEDKPLVLIEAKASEPFQVTRRIISDTIFSNC